MYYTTLTVYTCFMSLFLLGSDLTSVTPGNQLHYTVATWPLSFSGIFALCPSRPANSEHKTHISRFHLKASVQVR